MILPPTNDFVVSMAWHFKMHRNASGIVALDGDELSRHDLGFDADYALVVAARLSDAEGEGASDESTPKRRRSEGLRLSAWLVVEVRAPVAHDVLLARASRLGSASIGISAGR